MHEEDVIERAKAGDPDAIRSLYAMHAGRVYAVARRIAGDDATAEDWAQEAWIRAIRALPTFRSESRFSTWLHRIAVNTALHGMRSSTRRVRREKVLRLEAHQDARPAKPLLRFELQEALDELPDGMRRILILHDVEGYTHDEIGALLGIAAGTSKSQLFKARARMRSLLETESIEKDGEEACLI